MGHDERGASLINLYRATITIEAYVLAQRHEDAELTLSRDYQKGSVMRVLDCCAELATEVPSTVETIRPLEGAYVTFGDVPGDRREWTCARWAAALPGDVAAEVARLREEAAKAEATMAGLRAKAAELEALAQPKAPIARDPALDGDAKTTIGPHEDFAPLHPDMFGGTDYPEDVR